MAEPFRAQWANAQRAISAAQVNHLPIVAHFARRLGLVEMINRLVTTEMEVEPGLIALGLVLDTLSGRSPLYHVEKTCEECDRALLFARELPAAYVSDDTVGRMLDVFYSTSVSRNVPATHRAIQEERCACAHRHRQYVKRPSPVGTTSPRHARVLT